MADDGAFGIVQMMRAQGAMFNPPSICSGEVISPWPEISIKIGDLILVKEDLKVADYLTKPYEREVTINGMLDSGTQSTSGGSGDDSFASHSHVILKNADIKGTITFDDTLKKGDEVAMIASEDENTYFVLCRVV